MGIHDILCYNNSIVVTTSLPDLITFTNLNLSFRKTQRGTLMEEGTLAISCLRERRRLFARQCSLHIYSSPVLYPFVFFV